MKLHGKCIRVFAGLACLAAVLIITGCSQRSKNSSMSPAENILASTQYELDKKEYPILTDTTIVTAGEVNLNEYSGIVEIAAKGTYHVTGSLVGGFLYVSADKGTVLELEDVSITANGSPAFYALKDISIKMIGDSALNVSGEPTYDKFNAGLLCRGDLNLSGEGSLSVTVKDGLHAISGKDNISMASGTVVLMATKDCIHVNEDFRMDGGDLVMTAGDECVQSDGRVVITGGSIAMTSSGDAIKSKKKMTIDGGEIAAFSAKEGLESDSSIEINDGNLTISAEDDCINSDGDIVINGGALTMLSSANDGIDSNRRIEINGGEIYASGLTVPECGIDCDSNDLIINGGTITAIGSSASVPTGGTQHYLLIDTRVSQNLENVVIKDQSGNIVYEREFNASLVMGSEGGKQKDAMKDKADKKEAVKDKAGKKDMFGKMDKIPEEGPPAFNMPFEKAEMSKDGKGGMGMTGEGIVLLVSGPDLIAGDEYHIFVNGNEI